MRRLGLGSPCSVSHRLCRSASDCCTQSSSGRRRFRAAARRAMLTSRPSTSLTRATAACLAVPHDFLTLTAR